MNDERVLSLARPPVIPEASRHTMRAALAALAVALAPVTVVAVDDIRAEDFERPETSQSAAMSAVAISGVLGPISKPATPIEIVKNADYALRQGLLRYDAFYTAPNLERVFGMERASATTIAATKWTTKEQVLQSAREACTRDGHHNAICEFKAIGGWLDNVVGKKDVEAYWGNSAISKHMGIFINRWLGGPYYCCGHSNAVLVRFKFNAMNRPNLDETRAFLLGEGYRIASEKAAPGRVNAKYVWMSGLGDDGSRREIRLEVQSDGTVSFVHFEEEFN